MAHALSALLKTPEPPDEKAKLPDKRGTRGRDNITTISSQCTTNATANERNGCETRKKLARKSEMPVASSNLDDTATTDAKDGGTVPRRGKIQGKTQSLITTEVEEKGTKEIGRTASDVEVEPLCLPGSKETLIRTRKRTVTFASTVEVKLEDEDSKAGENSSAAQIDQSLATSEKKTRSRTKKIPNEVDLEEEKGSKEEIHTASYDKGEQVCLPAAKETQPRRTKGKVTFSNTVEVSPREEDSQTQGKPYAAQIPQSSSTGERKTRRSVKDIPDEEIVELPNPGRGSRSLRRQSLAPPTLETHDDAKQLDGQQKSRIRALDTKKFGEPLRNDVCKELRNRESSITDVSGDQKGAAEMEKERFRSPSRRGSTKILVDVPAPVVVRSENDFDDTTQKGNDKIAVFCKSEETKEKAAKETRSTRGNVRAHLEPNRQVAQSGAEDLGKRQKKTSKPKVGNDGRNGSSCVEPNEVGDVPLSENSRRSRRFSLGSTKNQLIQAKTITAEPLGHTNLEDSQQTDELIAASKQLPNNRRAGKDIPENNGRFVPHESAEELILGKQLIQTKGVATGQTDILPESDRVDKPTADSKKTRRAGKTAIGCNGPDIADEGPDKLKNQDAPGKQLIQINTIASDQIPECEQVDDLTASSKQHRDKGRRGKTGSVSKGLNVPQAGMEKQKIEDPTEAQFRSTRSNPKTPTTQCADKGLQKSAVVRRSRRGKICSSNEEASDESFRSNGMAGGTMEDGTKRAYEATPVQDMQKAVIEAISQVPFGEGDITDDHENSEYPSEEQSEMEMHKKVDAVVCSGQLEPKYERYVSETKDTEADKGCDELGNELMQLKEKEGCIRQAVANDGVDYSDLCGNEYEHCESISKVDDKEQEILTAECNKHHMEDFGMQSNFLPSNRSETVEPPTHNKGGSLECLSKDATEIAEPDAQLKEPYIENGEIMETINLEVRNSFLPDTDVEPTVRLMSEESQRQPAIDNNDPYDPVGKTVDANSMELSGCAYTEIECNESNPSSDQNGSPAETYLGEEQSKAFPLFCSLENKALVFEKSGNCEDETEAHLMALHRDVSVDGNNSLSETLGSNLEEQKTKNLAIMSHNHSNKNGHQTRARAEFVDTSHIKIDEETNCACSTPISIHEGISDSKPVANLSSGNVVQVSTLFGQPIDFRDTPPTGGNSSSSKVSSLIDEAVEALKLSEGEAKENGEDAEECVVATSVVVPPVIDSLGGTEYVDVSLKDLQERQMKEADVPVVDSSAVDNLDSQMQKPLDSMNVGQIGNDEGYGEDECIAASMPVLNSPSEHAEVGVLNPVAPAEDSSIVGSEEQACLSKSSSDTNQNSRFVQGAPEDDNDEDDQQEITKSSGLLSSPLCNSLPDEEDHRSDVSFVMPDDNEAQQSLVETDPKDHIVETEIQTALADAQDGTINDNGSEIPFDLAIVAKTKPPVCTPEKEHSNLLDILPQSGNNNDAAVIKTDVCKDVVSNSIEICGISALHSSQCTLDKKLELDGTIAGATEGMRDSMNEVPCASEGDLWKVGKGCGKMAGATEFSREKSMEEMDLTLLSLRKLRAMCKENGPSVRKQSEKTHTVHHPREPPSAAKRSALTSLPSNVTQTHSTAEQTPNAKLPNTPRPRSFLSAYQGNDSGARSQPASSSKKATRNASPARMAWR